jgi:hypothetical protein
VNSLDSFLAWMSAGLGGLLMAVITVLLSSAEIGFRCGRRWGSSTADAESSQIGSIQAAVLGMLGLLLAFTFSMAAERYDARRGLVLKEANAIGTAWLRGGLLPEPHRQPVRDLLRDYVDVRLRAYAEQLDPVLLAEGLRKSAEIQSQLWRHAEAAAVEAPNDITATFVSSLNDVIDTDAERVAAGRNRIPGGVWLILLVVSAVGCWTSAYASGAQKVRSALTGALLPLLITVVLLLVFDLMSERRGFIEVSQQPLVDLQTSIRSGFNLGPR